MEAPTTPAERQVRVSALAHAASPEALAAVLEAGALALIEDEHESGEVNHLAASVAATFEPEVPEFEPGEAVAREGVTIGVVRSRYLSERGGWEYQVYSRRHGTSAYAQADLDHAGGA